MAAQEAILMNGKRIKQPDKDLGYDFETTYTEDTTRTIIGPIHLTPIFTVEALSYQATELTIQEIKQILSIVAKGNAFTLHYFSPYYGEWRNDKFYVAKGNIKIGTLKVDEERFSSLSFTMTGVNPID